MSTVRVIRKYPNRRLYDTEDSRYITLADVRDLVLRRVEFVVIDKKNGHDITRCVLLQVISEREQKDDPVLSRTFLSQIIRAYDGEPPASLSAHLEQSLSMFLNQRMSASAADTTVSVRSWKALQEEAHRRSSGSEEDRNPAGQEQVAAERKKAS